VLAGAVLSQTLMRDRVVRGRVMGVCVWVDVCVYVCVCVYGCVLTSSWMVGGQVRVLRHTCTCTRTHSVALSSSCGTNTRARTYTHTLTHTHTHTHTQRGVKAAAAAHVFQGHQPRVQGHHCQGVCTHAASPTAWALACVWFGVGWVGVRVGGCGMGVLFVGGCGWVDGWVDGWVGSLAVQSVCVHIT